MKKTFAALLMTLSWHALADVSCVDGVELKTKNPHDYQKASVYIEVVEDQDNNTELHTYWKQNTYANPEFKLFSKVSRIREVYSERTETASSTSGATYLSVVCYGDKARITVSTQTNSSGTNSINYYGYRQ